MRNIGISRACKALTLSTLLFSSFTCRSLTVDDPVEFQDRSNCTVTAYHFENLCDFELSILEAAQSDPLTDSSTEVGFDAYRDLARSRGNDYATAVFFHRVNSEPRNARYIDRIRQISANLDPSHLPDYSSKNALLLMVPGMFYTLNAAVGGDGQEIRTAAQQLGARAALMLVEPDGTVDENAADLCQWLSASNERNIVLASLSKGGSDIKRALQICGDTGAFDNVRAWLNIGGLNRGSYLINEMDDYWWTRWRAKFYFWKENFNYDGILSIRSMPGEPLYQDLEIPDHIRVINLMATPLEAHITARARHGYSLLQGYGPNDGLTVLADSYMEGAINVSWFGNDHYFAVEETRRQFLYAGLAEVLQSL
ncbi:MAG: hypothetical protein H7A21_14565 [Spirochaetales bacterium]|nr:hypothetical protein [Leptospiraceae bacterium]MCP5482656.1 hypothetical protein [Spirochaetales bacterium]MCP5485038.1 hypothetical protein [Spirochaetales bacterium]